MLKPLQVFLFAIIATSVNAQTSTGTDSTKPNNDCNDIFTLAQQMPTLKIDKAVYEDSLTKYLQSKNVLTDSGHIILQMTISKSGDIINIEQIESSFKNDKVFLDAILAFSNFWTPGKQNNHFVCAYRKLIIGVTRHKISVTMPFL
jgi:hypothetical protein